jgi:hypothetical protein
MVSYGMLVSWSKGAYIGRWKVLGRLGVCVSAKKDFGKNCIWAAGWIEHECEHGDSLAVPLCLEFERPMQGQIMCGDVRIPEGFRLQRHTRLCMTTP